MNLLFITVAVGCLSMAVYHYWVEQVPPNETRRAWRSYLSWAVRGVLVPLLVWIAFHIRLGLGPSSPGVPLPLQTAAVLFVIVSWWTAVSLSWISARIWRGTPERSLFAHSAAMALLLASPVALLIIFALQQAGLGLAFAVCSGAVVHGTSSLRPRQKSPSYAKAIANIAFDKFNEAEWEIIKQLESRENDYEGWMLLAELYAKHFRDLPAAEQTICDLCDDPQTNVSQMAAALHRLADWHLAAGNEANARWALEQICRKAPGTHLCRMAELRIGQLQSQRAAVSPAPSEHAGSTTNSAQYGNDWRVPSIPLRTRTVVDAKSLAASEANECVERLKENPDDLETRRTFACILAEKVGQVDEAIRQVEWLLAVPGQTPETRAGWLMLQADWHARLRRDEVSARNVLERVIAELPGSPQAFEAQRRMYVLQINSNRRQRRM